MSLETGQIIDGKYRIVRRLGVGGMGEVYEGENVRIHRKVAIKVLHAAVANKADIVQRFEREAQAAGRIGSRHIVEVLDLGNLPGGERFMVMEYLDGESLGDRLKRVTRLGPAELVPIVVQVLDGLGAAHDAGIVHRDLKPDNVYLLKPRSTARPEEFVKLLDFGVSKFSSLDSDMSMTSTGAVMGTPYYLSPEQARGGKVDARSDLYAIGVVLYQCLAGRVPFHANSFNELLFKIALESPDPLGAVVPGIDPALVALVDRGMAREPGARFQSAAEMRDALVGWATGSGNIALRLPATTGPAAHAFGASGASLPGLPLGGSLALSGAGAAATPPGGMTGGGSPGAMHASSAGAMGATPAGGMARAPLHVSGAMSLPGARSPLPGAGGAPGGGSPGSGGGPFGQSGSHGQSGGALGQSGGPLGQSGLLGQSGGPLGQSGGGTLGQSGGGVLGQSGGAMAVTSPRPARKPVLALVSATLLAGCALGFGMWHAFGGKTAAADATSGQGSTVVAAAPPAETDEASRPEPTADAAPSNEPAASSAPEASAAPRASSAPRASTAPVEAPTTAPGSTSKAPAPKTSGKTKPPSSKPPAGGGGRVITPTL